jgi:hypothetical protein
MLLFYEILQRIIEQGKGVKIVMDDNEPLAGTWFSGRK